jgi:DNA-binding beta-propeller fold protein YncE
MSDKVLEIDTSTMSVLREFQIPKPGFIRKGINDNYVYVVSEQTPSYLYRIDTQTGFSSNISIPPGPGQFYLAPSTNSLWVLGMTWPAPDEGYSSADAYLHPETGRLSEISLDTFSIIQTGNIKPLPMSLIYSEYTDKFYIIHEMKALDLSTTQEEGNVVYETDPITFEQDRHFLSGPDSRFEGFPMMDFWSDDGRYVAVPNCMVNDPHNCITVFDLETWEDVTNEKFPQVLDIPIGVRIVRKNIGNPFIYCVGWPKMPDSDDEPIIMINTETGNYDISGLPGARLFTDIAISPNSCKIYLPSTRTDEIYVLDKPNTNPISNFYVVTSMPYIGSSPAAIEFDASGSRDNDPCDELTYEWDFDGDLVFSESVHDSYTGDPANPTHNYTSDYTGPVNLRVTDSHSAFGMCTRIVTVIIQ